MGNLYRSILSLLVRRELRKIASVYPMSIDDLINYHDFMAVEAMDNQRILGVCLITSSYLEELKSLHRSN